MACGDSKCVPPCEILLYSITIRPAMSVNTEVPFSTAWMLVPVRFCFGVWVGCKTRMAWVVRRMPAELRS